MLASNILSSCDILIPAKRVRRYGAILFPANMYSMELLWQKCRQIMNWMILGDTIKDTSVQKPKARAMSVYNTGNMLFKTSLKYQFEELELNGG